MDVQPIGDDECASMEAIFSIARTGVPAYVAKDPMSCVAVGAGRALEHLPIFRDSLTPV